MTGCLGNGTGNLWVFLSIPIPATHGSQAASHSRYGFHQGINKKYIYLIIYFTTIIKPPYKQVLIGMDHGWAQRKKKKEKKTAQEMSVSWACPLITVIPPPTPHPL